METAARQLKVDPGGLRKKNFITQFPLSDARHHGLRHRRTLMPSTRCGDEGDRLCRLRQARKAKAKADGKLRGIGVSCYNRGPAALRPRKRSAAWAAGVGLWESAEIRVNTRRPPSRSSRDRHSHGQGHETTFCATDRRTSRAFRSARVQIVHGRYRQGAVRHGHLRVRASIAVGGTAIIKAMEKVEGQGQEDCVASVGGVRRGDIVIENGEFKVTGNRQCRIAPLPMVRAPRPIPRTILARRAWSPAWKETAF